MSSSNLILRRFFVVESSAGFAEMGGVVNCGQPAIDGMRITLGGGVHRKMKAADR